MAFSPLCPHKPFFCLPFRLGAIVVSVLAVNLEVIFSAILWYEYTSVSSQLPEIQTSLLLAAILQALFVLISSFGFAGFFLNRRPFITGYAYSVVVHLVANVIVITYFLQSSIETDNQCSSKLPPMDQQPREPCNIFKIPKTVYMVAAIVVLVIEFYDAFVITTYLYQLRMEDEHAQESLILSWKMGASSARPVWNRGRLLSDASSAGLLPQLQTSWRHHNATHNPESSTLLARQLDLEAAEGYYGGRLSYNDIKREEKARLREMEETGGRSSSPSHFSNEPSVVRREIADVELPSYDA